MRGKTMSERTTNERSDGHHTPGLKRREFLSVGALPLAAAFYDPTEKRLLYSSETFRTSWGMEDAGGDVSLRGLFLSHCDDETAGAVIDQILDVGRDITEVTVDTENGSHILHCRRLEAPASGILIVER